MSKFVTYGATETLDNDQKFIIDSDRTGPGSITAKDAASSLLSKWAGFDTFEEAVQNTISNNQEFIDRDAAIRSETADLKKKIVTTFPAKDASGAVATFESEFEDAPLKSCIVRVEPVQDLHGYDHPWPAGGGTNQWDEQWEVGGLTSAGAPVTDETKIRSVNYVPVLPNTTYYGVAPSTMGVRFYDENKAFVGTANGTNQAFVTPSNSYFLKFFITATAYEKNVSINYPATVTTYAPYSNECPITGWTGCEVQRTGKNLLGGDDFANNIKQNLPNAVIDASVGTVSFGYSASTASAPVLDGVPFKENTRYTFVLSALNALVARTNLNIYYTDGTSSIIGMTKTNEKELVVVSSAANKTVKCLALQRQGGTTALYYDECGVFEGVLTTDDFVHYTGRTYPITFPTEAGTVYGGHIDPINGELVVDTLNLVLDGTESGWQAYGDNVCYNASLLDKTLSLGTQIKGYCSHVATLSTEMLDGTYFQHSNSGKGLEFRGVTDKWGLADNTPATIKAFLASEYDKGTPVQIVAYLQSPIHYPLTPTEIKTLLGQNNIWSNTGDTAVEYLMSDVSWYVEKKLKAFQSVLAGVEDSAVASKNYSTNTYLIFNDDIYRVTKAITAGETIEEGVNVTKTTVAEQLMALAQA